VSDEYVGVDVGGTKIAAAVLRDGGLSKHGLEPTNTTSTETILGDIAGAVERVRSDATVAVGVGVPSVIDWERGRARTSVNIPLEGVPLRDELSKRLGLPVFVDNDATLAALAEAHDGDRLVVRNLVMFTVGTGVGGGLVLDGRPYRGATGAAGELGHTLIGLDLERGAPEPSGFPQPGSLESAGAGSVLDRIAAASAAEHPDSHLGRIAAAGEPVSGRDAVAGAQAGDPVAVDALRLLGERLGIGVANAINTFDPDVVSIGGGVSIAGDLLLEPTRRTALGYVLPGVGVSTEIRLSVHGPEAGVLGASLLAKQELERQRGQESR
jgi:glucokinase